MTATYFLSPAGPRRLVVTLLTAGLLGLLPGCPPTAEPVDGGADAPAFDVPSTRPDGSRSCSSDEECDDDVACTIDRCNVGGFCENRSDPAPCDDSIFCNGLEVCHPTRGCIAGPRESCDDMDVCTIDRCNETDRRCDHSARDLDDDGDVDFFCTGGGDCDDFDATRSSLVREVCGDVVDNDCDGDADDDDPDGCGRAPYDVCAPLAAGDGPPLDVSAGGTFTLSTLGAANDYALSCGSRPDLVAVFTIPAGAGPQDLRVEAQGSFGVSVALRTDCESAVGELECQSYYPTVLRRRGLAEGTYYLILGADPFQPFTLDVELSPATPAPTNESCTSPADLAPGTITGSFADVTDDMDAGCASSGQLDLVYRFTVPADGPHDVRISLNGAGNEFLSFAVRSTCDDALTAVQCASGSPARARIHQLAPGDYFLIVQGASYDEADFTLALDILPPTPRLVGDTCASPIPLTIGTPYEGSLSGMEHDFETRCGGYDPEVVHEIVLTEDSDLTIEVNGSSYLAVALRGTPCDAVTNERVCRQGRDTLMRIHDLAAGTYYLVIESSYSPSYTITTTAVSPPVIATPVTGNDTCAGAIVVPETGGFYTGSTVTALNDVSNPTMCGFTIPAAGPDVAFRLNLSAPRHVIASLEGTAYSALLVAYEDNCASSGLDLYCSYDYPFPSIERTLDAGTYFFVVDGYGTFNVGTYSIEFIITDP